MKFNKMKILPLVAKLGDYLKEAFDHYVNMKASGVEVDADMLAIYISDKMKDWTPKFNGKELLDPETRDATARFVAGIAFNLAK